MARTISGWIVAIGLWVITLDFVIRAFWAWIKLGSFGVHAPWTLFALIASLGLIAFFLLRFRE